MRLVRGVERARRFLLKRRPLWREVPAALKRRMAEALGRRLTPEKAVDYILGRVRREGDAALRDLGGRLDGVVPAALEVTPEERRAAYRKVNRRLLATLRLVAERVRAFHAAQRPTSWLDFHEGGLGQIVRPLERVGLYVPGGTAAYPSTVLMTAIPARVAGVTEIVLTTPPQRDGSLPSLTLVAADLAGVDRIFKVGGAQAIAALAFGTESVPRVDKICGPGNLFVMLAKKKVFGLVGIDALQGPTETVVLADDSANPAICAADLLAQAEHDVLASAILITTSPSLAAAVAAEVQRQLSQLERSAIAAEALQRRGAILLVKSQAEAVELANLCAPEHLCLLVEQPWAWLGPLRHAGGIFLGETSPEVLGDYVAGPSHVMPTGGTARFSSPLNVWDFVKITSLVALDEKALKALGPAAATLARAEGLTAHALAVEARLGKKKAAAGPRRRASKRIS